MKTVHKEIKQQHAGKSKQPLPGDKPQSYWHTDKKEAKLNKSPQREREKRELNEESMEEEPEKAIPHKTRKK